MRYIPQLQQHSLQNHPLPAGESLDELQLAFVQNVEHELRTPLTIVLGYAELMRDESLGPLTPEQRQATFSIVNHTCEMRTLVDRIGALLAAEAHMGVALPIALAELAADLVEYITLECQCSPKLTGQRSFGIRASQNKLTRA